MAVCKIFLVFEWQIYKMFKYSWPIHVKLVSIPKFSVVRNLLKLLVIKFCHLMTVYKILLVFAWQIFKCSYMT